MLILKRKRLFVWLIKAYLKKWGLAILVSFGVGLVLFSLLFLNKGFLLSRIFFTEPKSIGLVGSFYVQELPSGVLNKVADGLTNVDLDGVPKPGLASSWQISDGGKKYTFHLKTDKKFTSGSKFKSKDVNYNFKNVKVERPDDHTIIFELQDAYAPFLVTVSQKIFKDKYVGTGSYKMTNLKLNAGYVQSLELVNAKNSEDRINYQFYPTEEALKIAFALGEVDEAQGVNLPAFSKYDLTKFKKVSSQKGTDYRRLVTLFYNTNDKDLSNKILRKALAYSLPRTFPEGERAYSPVRPMSWANSSSSVTYLQDIDHSKLLLKEVEASGSAKIKLNIKTLKSYRRVAEEIAKTWNGLGIQTTVEEVAGIPDITNYSVFLGDLYLPRDPDQYSIWHSGQYGNISNYRSIRIDKLLEDGRRTVNLNERKSIYADFEKYLLDDSPASFLYFPASYTISRRPS
jgi:ABC-type transport system substrate-binding protein